MMKKVKHHTLHQYRRELSTSGTDLALIPHELPISMNALPSSPAQQWHHLRATINLLCRLSRSDIPEAVLPLKNWFIISPASEASESINVAAYERWYDFYIRKKERCTE
jgi:hypothetical protein